MEGKIMKVVTTSNKIIDVNISDEMCTPFGFTNQQVALRPDGHKAIIVGVAPNEKGFNVLWYTIDHKSIGGKVWYLKNSENKNLKKDFGWKLVA